MNFKNKWCDHNLFSTAFVQFYLYFGVIKYNDRNKNREKLAFYYQIWTNVMLWSQPLEHVFCSTLPALWRNKMLLQKWSRPLEHRHVNPARQKVESTVKLTGLGIYGNWRTYVFWVRGWSLCFLVNINVAIQQPGQLTILNLTPILEW